MYAIAGSHRSGKTTLAKELAARNGLKFLQTDVSDVFVELGLSPKQPLSYPLRLQVQEAILTRLENLYARQTAPFIADRSPYDVMGYTMAEIQRDTLDPKLLGTTRDHFARAARIGNQYIKVVFFLDPLPMPAEADTSAQACPLYMEHVSLCIRQAIRHAQRYCPIPDQSLANRIWHCEQIITKV